MGWSLGYDENWKRDIGYSVPSVCDHPDCNERIDRGLSYVCGGDPYGGESGCGLFFCSMHRIGQLCERCGEEPPQEPFEPKPDLPEWKQRTQENNGIPLDSQPVPGQDDPSVS